MTKRSSTKGAMCAALLAAAALAARPTLAQGAPPSEAVPAPPPEGDAAPKVDPSPASAPAEWSVLVLAPDVKARVTGDIARIAAPANASVAEAASIPSFESMRTPASPAFDLLGLSPSQIEKPGSVRELSVSLAQDFLSKDGVAIPRNFALEVAPFWLTPLASAVTAEEYESAEGPDHLWERLSLSAATATDTGVASGPTLTHLAVGARTSFIDGEPRTSCAARIEQVAKALSIAAAAQAGHGAELVARHDPDYLAAALAAGVDPETVEPSDMPKSVRAAYRAVLNDPKRHALFTDLDSQASRDAFAASKAELERLNDECPTSVLSSRVGLRIDGAIASAWRVTDGAPESAVFDTGAVWTTVTYDWPSIVSIVGLLRGNVFGLTREQRAVTSAVDFGIRGVLAAGDVAVSGEALGRLELGPAQANATEELVGNFLWGASGNAAYMVADGLWLSATIGRRFTRAASGTSEEEVSAVVSLTGDLIDPSVIRCSLATANTCGGHLAQ